MKLLTKIYLAFAVILLIFSFVTLSYVLQSTAIDRDVRETLRATDVMRLSEASQKAIIDTETGIRGFQVTSNDVFLEPYHSGLQTYNVVREELRQKVKNQMQKKRLAAIDSAYAQWLNQFANVTIQLKKSASRSATGAAAYNNFQDEFILSGKGKEMMDNIRSRYKVFDQKEQIIRNQKLENLEKTMRFTDQLAIALTAVSILLGLITVTLLAKAIQGRLKEIAEAASEVAQGHFSVNIQDQRNDEITQVSHSLNLMAKQLDDSFTSLKKTNRELDQFAYVVSHDLKAPLRAINSLAEWIQEDLPDVDPDIQRNLDLMRGRVYRMENLINGILDYSRIGRKQLPQSTFQVSALLDEILDSLSPANEVSVTVVTAMPQLTTERVLLQQVLANLIGNAIKYNNNAAPEVSIACKEQKGKYQFSVQDNGPGIPAEYHEKVFGVFQTMEARDTKESTGIGLAIVKKIVEEKGGVITLISEEGQGSKFSFTWPKSTVKLTAAEPAHLSV